ncbi:glutamine amidotransferase, partial [Streptococcus suis]
QGTHTADGGEGLPDPTPVGSSFHRPRRARTANLAYRLVTTALRKKYGQDIQLASYADILSKVVAE